MGRLYTFLFWFLTIGTCSSGSAFIFKTPGWYHPDAYLVNGMPGTGKTDFEITATFVFALVYLTPIFGFVHAHYEGTASARRSASIAPMLYHLGSTLGVLFIFGDYLNPEVAPISLAAGMHAVMAILFVAMYFMAFDEPKKEE